MKRRWEEYASSLVWIMIRFLEYLKQKSSQEKTCETSIREIKMWDKTQLTFTCSKSTIETLGKGVKYVQS